MKILISGGPVHAHLDAVKILTNKFKGGLMARLAEELSHSSFENDVTYLSAKGSKQPVVCGDFVHHNGYDDYRKKVVDMADDFDVVILGGAVVNLIPVNPWKGKFPSHNYKEGDEINIPFTIAPRVINEIKKSAGKGPMLFGFKLLSGVEHEELIDAAYEVLLGSKATAVFANDATDLETIHVVTKERAVHTISRASLADEIMMFAQDRYFKTQLVDYEDHDNIDWSELEHWVKKYHDKFKRVGDYVFGTVAVRCKDGTFLTTARGKNEVEEFVKVTAIENRTVYVNGKKKATLNAPLLGRIFHICPEVHTIVHLHEQRDDMGLYSYAPSGTIRDSWRCFDPWGFNVEGHGCYIFFDKDGKQITRE